MAIQAHGPVAPATSVDLGDILEQVIPDIPGFLLNFLKGIAFTQVSAFQAPRSSLPRVSCLSDSQQQWKPFDRANAAQ